MSLESFVQASGAVMGLVRDAFGLDGLDAGVVPTSGPLSTLAAAFSGSGQAATASNNESNVVDGHVSALNEQDLGASSDLAGALAAAGAGRGQMDAVIAGALADINSLAAATTTPAGQQSLVSALALRLQQAWQVLTTGNVDASSRTVSSAQLAAGYSGVGSSPVGGTVTTAPATYYLVPVSATAPASAAAVTPSTAAMVPMAAMAANQAAVSSAAQAASAKQSGSNSGIQLTSAVKSTATGDVKTVIQRALNEVGLPYVWGGGGLRGPTGGGFDCSGLTQYAYAGVGVDLPRTTYGQINVGHAVSPSNIQPGDLIFSYFGEGGNPGPGHVQLAIGHGSNSQVVEAPYTGADVRVTGIAPGRIVVKRILG